MLHGPLLESSKADARLVRRAWESLPHPSSLSPSLSIHPPHTPRAAPAPGTHVSQRPPRRTGWVHGWRLNQELHHRAASQAWHCRDSPWGSLWTPGACDGGRWGWPELGWGRERRERDGGLSVGQMLQVGCPCLRLSLSDSGHLRKAHLGPSCPGTGPGVPFLPSLWDAGGMHLIRHGWGWGSGAQTPEQGLHWQCRMRALNLGTPMVHWGLEREAGCLTLACPLQT